MKFHLFQIFVHWVLKLNVFDPRDGYFMTLLSICNNNHRKYPLSSHLLILPNELDKKISEFKNKKPYNVLEAHESFLDILLKRKPEDPNAFYYYKDFYERQIVIQQLFIDAARATVPSSRGDQRTIPKPISKKDELIERLCTKKEGHSNLFVWHEMNLKNKGRINKIVFNTIQSNKGIARAVFELIYMLSNEDGYIYHYTNILEDFDKYEFGENDSKEYKNKGQLSLHYRAPKYSHYKYREKAKKRMEPWLNQQEIDVLNYLIKK